LPINLDFLSLPVWNALFDGAASESKFIEIALHQII
jgi:hypothetical protein